MRDRRPVTPDDVRAIRDLAGDGLTADQIGMRLGRSAQVVRNLANARGIALAAESRGRALTPGRAAELRAINDRLYAAGPEMGCCPTCRTWRPLAGWVVSRHPRGEHPCPGSGRHPLPRREEP